MAVVVDKENCIGCGACTGVCPVGALELDGDGKSECDPEKCISCLTCVGACPVSAISEGE
jgi:ferredoxin